MRLGPLLSENGSLGRTIKSFIHALTQHTHSLTLHSLTHSLILLLTLTHSLPRCSIKTVSLLSRLVVARTPHHPLPLPPLTLVAFLGRPRPALSQATGVVFVAAAAAVAVVVCEGVTGGVGLTHPLPESDHSNFAAARLSPRHQLAQQSLHPTPRRELGWRDKLPYWCDS